MVNKILLRVLTRFFQEHQTAPRSGKLTRVSYPRKQEHSSAPSEYFIKFNEAKQWCIEKTSTSCEQLIYMRLQI